MKKINRIIQIIIIVAVSVDMHATDTIESFMAAHGHELTRFCSNRVEQIRLLQHKRMERGMTSPVNRIQCELDMVLTTSRLLKETNAVVAEQLMVAQTAMLTNYAELCAMQEGKKLDIPPRTGKLMLNSDLIVYGKRVAHTMPDGSPSNNCIAWRKEVKMPGKRIAVREVTVEEVVASRDDARSTLNSFCVLCDGSTGVYVLVNQAMGEEIWENASTLAWLRHEAPTSVYAKAFCEVSTCALYSAIGILPINSHSRSGQMLEASTARFSFGAQSSKEVAECSRILAKAMTIGSTNAIMPTQGTNATGDVEGQSYLHCNAKEVKDKSGYKRFKCAGVKVK